MLPRSVAAELGTQCDWSSHFEYSVALEPFEECPDDLSALYIDRHDQTQ